jgi:hypothetical protein
MKSEEELLDEAAAEADEDETEETAPVDKSDAPRRGRPKRKRKKERGGRVSASGDLATGESTEARAIASKDAAVIWDHVLEEARKTGRSPELIGISVKRFGLGAYPSEAQDLQMINGELVMGDERTSPGDALVRYITDVYHLTTANSPKLYKLSFHFRIGTRNQIAAPIAELRLGHPDEIRASQASAARYAHEKMIADAVKGSRPVPATGSFGAIPGYAPPPQPYQPLGYPSQGQAPYPGYYPPPPIQGASPEFEAMRRELAATMGALNERARLEGLIPPPAPPAAPVVAGPTPEETAARTAQIVAQVMTGMGFTPALAAKLNSPQLSPAAVQGAITDPLELLDKAFEQMDRFRKLDKRMEERYTPEEEEEKPVVVAPIEATKVEVDKTIMKPIPIPLGFTGGKQILYGERGPEESAIDYGIRLFMHNPETGANVLAIALKSMSNSAVGQAVAGLISKGMPGVAQMVQAQHQAQLNGAPNGVAGHQPPAQAPAAGPVQGWGPPKI